MATQVYENIFYEKKAPIVYVTLNRPEKLNAISQELQLEVRDALGDAGWHDDNIRVIIMKGVQRCLSSGFDLSEGGNDTDVMQVRAHFLKGQGFSAIT